MKRASRLPPLRVKNKNIIGGQEFMARAIIKGYHILPKGHMKIPAGNAQETEIKGVTSTFKFLNKTAYNELIIG